MDIGKKIKDIRTSKGLSMYRITQITGISGHHIKGIEDGTRQPTIETLQKLLIPLGITLAELFSTDSSSTYLSDKERTLIENFRSLNMEKADALLYFSEVLKK
ncbi:MAG: helix-turn-helix domain-containing protein [Oscillospiraceae bacterium]|nr:helix-turn-helix domain-containing protein [Ruminococcus sp.]MBQ8011162.1 helix-turn-helix domain-containing protein [Oscillospiraceae bacterium]